MKTIKESYILLLIVLGLVSLGIYTTYAMFTASTTINDVVGITTTLDIGKSLTEYEIVVVEPNETKLIELNVINSYNDNIYYGAWYQIVQGNSEDIDIGLYTEKNSNPGSGVLSQNSNINLLAGITNDNSTSVIVYLGVKGSLTNELNLGSNKVLLPDGWSIVKNNAIDESGANYPDLVDGLVPVMYDGSKWVKADTKSSTSKYGWYDYNEKRWANAVLVNGETINDLSNNNNYGLIHNAVIEKDGLNITSDNSTYVTLPNDIGITFPMTYSITFNTNSTSNQVIFGDGNTKAGLGITNVGTNAQFIVVLGTENSTYTYNTGGIITNNDYTVDIVYHSLSDIEVYLNGNKLTKTTSKDFWSWTDNTKSYIGKRPSNVNNFSGIIKKFIVYDDELTLDEITHNYRVKNFDICDKGIICDNLKLYYNFVSSKNIVNDYSNNENTGLMYGTTIGESGLNITSDNNTYVELPYSIGATLPATYSITFSTDSTSNQVIFGDYNTKAGLGLINSNNQFIVVLGSENTTYTVNTGGLTLNKFYTVDIVYHSLSDIEVYLNGNKLTKTTSKDFWGWTDSKSYIGKRPSNVNNFSGIIKKFIVYDDELTLDEITHNYNTQDTTICDNGIICDNLKLYYNFTNGSEIINDLSNNKKNGKIFGAVFENVGLNITNDNDTYVELPYLIGATLPATYSITFSTDSTSNQVIFGDYNTKAGLGLINSNNQFIVVLGSENTTYTVNTGGLTLNKFYTVDIVYHSLSDIEVYLNGNKLTKTTSKDFWGWTDSKSYIGKRPSNVNNFSGIIKKFIVYDDELTLDEIIYNYGVTSHNICDNGIICDNLNLYYNFSSDEQINKDFYLNALPGTEVPIDEILAFYVWIPRFKYKVWNINKVIGTDSYNAYNTGIDIVFESEKKSTGIVNCTYSYNSPSSSANSPNETCTGSNGDYYTHPAFTFGSDNIRGFWIGKFELSNSGTSSNAIPKIIPNTEIWLDTSTTNQNITQFYNAIQNMQSEKNIYGLSMDKTNTDSHMITNYEWGAVAYLANSKYGRCTSGSCTNITINNCMISSDNTYTIIAGIGANSIADSSSETTCNNSTNKYNGTKGVLASTTGNITGVYDMSGGGGEYVMANISSTSGNYSFSSNKSDFLSSWYNITNNHKFVITYAYGTTLSDQTAYNRSRLGDATGEVILSSGGSGGWYNDAAEFPPKGSMGDTSWFVRGGSFLEKDKAGLFYFRNYSCASFVCYHSTRASLVSLK